MLEFYCPGVGIGPQQPVRGYFVSPGCPARGRGGAAAARKGAGEVTNEG